MIKSKEFLNGSHAIDEALQALESLESRNASLVGAIDGFIAENLKLRELLDACAILLTDRAFLHWPELLEQTLKEMREMGIGADDI